MEFKKEQDAVAWCDAANLRDQSWFSGDPLTEWTYEEVQ